MHIISYLDYGYPNVELIEIVHLGGVYFIPIMPRRTLYRLERLILVGKKTGKYGKAWQIIRRYKE